MKNLTEGNITKLIISFSMPLLFGNIFQLLYNLVDTRIVGEALGENAIGALGATSAITSVIVGLLMGLTTGFSLVTARHFGAKDMDKTRKTVAKALVLGLGTSIVFTVISLVFLDSLLKSLNTPAEIYTQAKDYIFIILAGMTATTLYNIFASVLRAVGDTISPLIFLIISTFINIGLDFLFIYSFHWGVKGAAFATVIAQVVSAVLCFIYILKKHNNLLPKKADFAIDLKMAGDMYASGVSMGLMISLVGIGTVVMQGAINGFGTKIVIAHTTARKISEIYFLPISVFGSAAATMAGQNYGAGNIKRVKQTIWKATLLTWGWSALMTVVTFLFTSQLANLITGITDNEILKIVDKYMKINISFYAVLTIVIIFRNGLQGMNDKISPILSSLLELVGKVVVAKALAPRLGYFGIMISEPLVWIGMAVILGIGFIVTLRRNRVIIRR